MGRINKFSSNITQCKSQGASQAMLYGAGLQDLDMNKAQVGIVSMWYEGNPCNMHLLDLGRKIKNSVQQAELVGMCFNTIGVSDGISMGTSGMRYSLQSRELIADSIETVMQAQWYDACIAIPGCDKNLPGCLMALARVDRPACVVYGGTINSGKYRDKSIDIVSAFQSYGQYLVGEIDEQERHGIIKKACPGPGACGGMYTANTMACAIEAMGMALPFSSSTPATDTQKELECGMIGDVIRNLLKKNITPKRILTKQAFENAITVVIALGGSTNAVLHLLAIAHSVGIDLKLQDFQTISDQVPLLGNLKPSGKYIMADLHAVGGTPAVMRKLLDHSLLHPDCLTVTGKTIAENVADSQIQILTANQDVIASVENPLNKRGHIKILHGNLAPDGAVAKITGKEGERFSGFANVFNSEDEMIKAFEEGCIKRGEVIIIRYVGPKGGPGMPEMLKPTSLIMGAGFGNDLALITDGRFSGGSHGFIVGHIAPEAQVGGPLALIENGDVITIDADSLTINVELDEFEIRRRKRLWRAPNLQVTHGTLYKYSKQVSSASLGCVTD